MAAIIHFDPDGDLTLVIGQDPNKANFVICSRTLSRASPVFKRMLNGNFVEARPTDGSPWVVNLPEDDVGVAEVLLAILHSRFDLVPLPKGAPYLRSLYEILVFTEKYDLTKLIRPWAQSWIPSAAAFSNSVHYNILIGIAWELGAKSELEHVARRMIAECGINPENGQLTGPASDDTRGLEDEALPLIPDGLLDTIAETRQYILDVAFSQIQTCIKVLRAAVVCVTPNSEYNEGFCKYNNLNQETLLCNTLTLGGFMAGFGQAELRSISASGSNVEVLYPRSINHLIEMICEIRPDICVDGHEDCPDVASNLVDCIKAAFDPNQKVMNILSQEHKEYLKKQQGKLGVVKAR